MNRPTLLTALLTLASGLWLSGCERSATQRPAPVEVPPHGGGQYTDGDQILRTAFRPLEFITYGDTREGQLPTSDVLIGYEFSAQVGNIPVVQTRASGRYTLALYGPRDDRGLWDAPLIYTHGADALTLTGLTVESPGTYFVLIKTGEGAGADYTLSLTCEGEGCEGEALCPDIEACDLVCDAGYAFDQGGCRLCACGEAACEPGTCPEGEICQRGACVPDGSCEATCPQDIQEVCGADGQTYRNPCTAQCAEVEVVSRGRCQADECGPERPCPEGAMCVEGRCERQACDCPDVNQPVCSESGRTWRNRCQMECRGETLDYLGECVRLRCTPEDARCPEGSVCAPAPRVPGNLRICTDNPRSEDCVYECQRPTINRCQTNDQCPRGTACYRPVPQVHGICLPGCELDGDRCAGVAVCAAVPVVDAAENEGVCLRPCGTGEEACSLPFKCLPDDRGVDVCRVPTPCDLCDFERDNPVCLDGVDYRSPCEALCAQPEARDRLQPGACDDGLDCARCPATYEPVCAGDRLFATACEARCRGVMPVERVEACFENPPPVACRRDEDCMRTCGGALCTAAPLAENACPGLSREAACHARHSGCECIDNRCAFEPTRTTARCLQDTRGRE